MRIRFSIIIFIASLISSCIKHQLSSSEIDDVYFTKKDIIKIEEDEDEAISDDLIEDENE